MPDRLHIMTDRLRQIRFRLLALFRRSRLDADMEEEMRSHIEILTAENVAAGMTPKEARHAALRSFGGVTQIEEQCREEHGFVWLDQLCNDVRLAFRSLLHARGFTITVLLIIGLCVGANTAIFSIVNSVLLRPLPFQDPGRLVIVHNNYRKAGLERLGVSPAHYVERKREISAFAKAGLRGWIDVNLDNAGISERISAGTATPSFFQTLGVNAMLGRVFTEEEGLTGKNQVVLLGHWFWRMYHNSDPSILGKTVRINNAIYTVIGVLPPGFRYFSEDPSFWLPIAFTAEDLGVDQRHSNRFEMVARLSSGSTLEEARSQIDALNERMLKIDPAAKIARESGFSTAVFDLHADHVIQLRPILLLLQVCVLVLLLIGAVNLANLVMVRATSRSKEYSLRQALGAGAFQLIRMGAVETTLLSLAGGLCGLGLGALTLSGLTRILTRQFPLHGTPEIDLSVCLFVIGISVALGLVLALPIAWFTLRGNLVASLTMESRGGTTTRSVHRLRHALIIIQISLAFVLLSGSGLLGLSLVRVLNVRPGFQAENRLTCAINLPSETYPGTSQRVAAVGRLLTAMRALPGVASATLSTGVPFSGRILSTAWEVVGESASSTKLVNEAVYTYYIAGDYFSTLGVPLKEGRPLGDDDVQSPKNECVIDEEFAQRHWPGNSALGRKISFAFSDPNDARRVIFTIVGVVGSVKQNDLTDNAPRGAIYLPLSYHTELMATVRTLQAPEALGQALRNAILQVDPSLQVFDLRSLSIRVEASLAGRRTPFILAATFAGVALLLAAVGIYGVLAYTVAQRRREIGVRMALGAQPWHILRQFLFIGFRILAIGLPLGLFGAWIAGRSMAGLLFNVAPTNLLVFVSTVFTLITVTLFACLLPSRRAALVNPVEALNSD